MGGGGRGEHNSLGRSARSGETMKVGSFSNSLHILVTVPARGASMVESNFDRLS